MAREVVDIKSENCDLKRLLQSRQPGAGFNNNVGESRHSVFEKKCFSSFEIQRLLHTLRGRSQS
jgi:hypothetical protein